MLLFQCFEQRGRQGTAVGCGIAYVGEDLRQRFGAVDAHKLLVFGQCFLGGVVAVNGVGCGGAVGLVVADGREGQAVGGGGVFGGPSQGDGGYGHHQFGKPEQADDFQWLVDGGAEKAEAEAGGFGQVAETLAEEQGIGGSVLVGEQVVVAGMPLALLRPAGGAVVVGTEGEHYGSLRDHGLVEVGRGELPLHLGGARHDYAVELQVAHGLGVLGLGEEAVEQPVLDGTVGILADGLAHGVKVGEQTVGLFRFDREEDWLIRI